MPRQRQDRVEEERADDPREDESRPLVWNPPSKLETPKARRGMTQKWVRKSLLGTEEPHHVASRHREGWRPRPAETAPDFPASKDGRIEMGGLLLCEMPNSMVEQRNAHYLDRTNQQDDAIAHDLHKAREQGEPSKFIQDRETKITRGGVPPVKDDDDGPPP